MTSLRSLLDDATRRLTAAGVGSPRVDAELLLAHCLGVERSRLATMDDVDPVTAQAFAAAVGRRAAREPLQHIVGRAAFRYLDLAVGPGAFVPRPETELLVDAIRPGLGLDEAPIVVDLCAGTGALALAIAQEVPGARVYAVERSAAALVWLRRNTAGTDVTVVEGDVADAGLLPDLRGRVDAVVSNPPYVPAGTPVEPEVRSDPDEAVFAGADGLGVIPNVLARAQALLRPGGVLAVEHDDTHGEAVPALLGEGWRDIADHHDLAGRPRYATAVRAAAP
ncbi:MAG TPA: peptide chain release factor N(5)-glutamine methyltransferase [Jatrophihabitantaceae bacterium]